MTEEESFPFPIVLGSSSKYRRTLLTSWAIPHTCFSADIDEYAIVPSGVPLEQRNQSPPDQLVLAVADAKSRAILRCNELEPKALLITSDQVVCFQGEIREKPSTPEQVQRWMHEYSREPAVLCTAIVVRQVGTERVEQGVCFASQLYEGIPEQVIEQLIKEEEVFDCCGALIISSGKICSVECFVLKET
jgi:septum formation protein